MRILTVFRLLCFCLVAAASLPTGAADERSDPIVFKISVLPNAARHLEFLAYPSYLALALENQGLSISYSSRLIIRDRANFETRFASIHYMGHKGAVYRYEARLKLPGMGESALAVVPVHVDTSSVAAGTLTITAFPPLAHLLPKHFLDRVEFKVRSLADIPSQRRLVQYLDELSKRASATPLDPRLEAVAIEAYNRGAPAAAGGGDVGDAEPLSEQLALLFTLAIWLIIVPAWFLARRWLRVRATRRRAS